MLKVLVFIFSLSFVACTDGEIQEPVSAAQYAVTNTAKTITEIPPSPSSVSAPLPPPAPSNQVSGETMYVTPSLLNVRSGPGMSNSVVRQATFQEKVGVHSVSRGWAKIGSGEYVAKKFLSSGMPSTPNDPIMAPSESYSMPIESTSGTSIGSSILEKAKGAASNAMDSVKGAGSNVMDSVKGVGSKAMDSVKGAGSNVMDAVKGAGSKAMDSVKGAASNAVDAVKGSDAAGSASSALQKAKDAASKTLDNVTK